VAGGLAGRTRTHIDVISTVKAFPDISRGLYCQLNVKYSKLLFF
jgi:hypothetical protein